MPWFSAPAVVTMLPAIVVVHEVFSCNNALGITNQEIIDSTGTETRQIFFRMSVIAKRLNSCLSLREMV